MDYNQIALLLVSKSWNLKCKAVFENDYDDDDESLIMITHSTSSDMTNKEMKAMRYAFSATLCTTRTNTGFSPLEMNQF